MIAAYVLLALAAYGLCRLYGDARRAWKRYRVRSAFREYQRTLLDIHTRFVSSMVATVRPQVPTTWREMVEVETAPVARAVVEARADTRGLN